MAIEKIRGCGFRKVGGLYIIGTGIAMPCDRLPYPLTVCPVCGQGIKVTTGWTWLHPARFFQGPHKNCHDPQPEQCPVCNPTLLGEQAGLLWVGSKFYSPRSFIAESEERGVSKRIGFIPSRLKLGETWILLAHKKAVKKIVGGHILDLDKPIVKQYETFPGIFYAFKPTRIEKLIWKSEATEKTLKDLRNRGITPVIIPDGDADHNPKRSIWTDLKRQKKQQESGR